MVVENELENASFSIKMSLYRNESLSSEIQAYDDVYVPDFIFVVVRLETDPTNERFYLQVSSYVRYSWHQLIIDRC